LAIDISKLTYRNHEADFWRKVIFVDEKTFSSSTQGRIRVWRSRGTRYNPDNVVETHESGHITQGFFGWMWAYGPGELTQIEGRFTGWLY